jgi:ABC-type xylose transport system permease subunit
MPFGRSGVRTHLMAALAWLLVHRSVYGRHLFAVGDNEEAVRYSGVKTRGVIAGAQQAGGILARCPVPTAPAPTRIRASATSPSRAASISPIQGRVLASAV